jgi:hypothetical protein
VLRGDPTIQLKVDVVRLGRDGLGGVGLEVSSALLNRRRAPPYREVE